MNLGNEIPGIGFDFTATLQTKITEDLDAFIIQTITPYCEAELGRRIEKQELIRAILNNNPRRVLRVRTLGRDAKCPSCMSTLDEESYPVACGYCGQRVSWEAEDE